MTAQCQDKETSWDPRGPPLRLPLRASSVALLYLNWRRSSGGCRGGGIGGSAWVGHAVAGEQSGIYRVDGHVSRMCLFILTLTLYPVAYPFARPPTGVCVSTSLASHTRPAFT